MEKIPSFQKNHDTLAVGLHAQTDANSITTFDLRFKKPNAGDYITPKALHTIEHLLATRLPYDEVLALLRACIPVALALEEVPGAKREECGNYLEHDLPAAKKELAAYLAVLEAL